MKFRIRRPKGDLSYKALKHYLQTARITQENLNEINSMTAWTQSEKMKIKELRNQLQEAIKNETTDIYHGLKNNNVINS